MSGPLRVLLLTSAGETSLACESLGNYLIARLCAKGATAETFNLQRALRTAEHREVLTAALNWADLIVLAFAQHFGSPPYFMVRLMEIVAENRPHRMTFHTQHLLCLVTSILPRMQENDTAVAICERFVAENDFVWDGALALGSDDTIDGQPLDKLGNKVRNVTRALDLAADALITGDHIPREALTLIAQPLVANWRYKHQVNSNLKRRAKLYGTERKLNDKPYG